MAVNPETQFLQSKGYSGRDIRHVTVRVFPAMAAENGALTPRHKAYAGNGAGDFATSVETDFIFVSADSDWEFQSFELGGQTWPGLAVFPADGDFDVRFGDDGPSSVVMTDRCNCLYTHRYQLVLRHRSTGEFALLDPEVGNDGTDLG